MAPIFEIRQFYSRYYCRYGYNGDGSCYHNGWGNWGRWVLLGAIILGAVLIGLAFSCFNARRRRRAGLHPRYGTGWATGKPPIGNAAPQYSAPPYTAPPPVHNQKTGNTFNGNDGYYGQQTGVELQRPQQAYHQQEQSPYQEYPPPAGPPPAHAKN